jgi:hypothetical protein
VYLEYRYGEVWFYFFNLIYKESNKKHVFYFILEKYGLYFKIIVLEK